MEVGTRHVPYKIASVSGYDCFVLAGIEENELFSKLVIMNMNVQYGLAFDINTNKISHHFPDNIQVINKKAFPLKMTNFMKIWEIWETKRTFF